MTSSSTKLRHVNFRHDVVATWLLIKHRLLRHELRYGLIRHALREKEKCKFATKMSRPMYTSRPPPSVRTRHHGNRAECVHGNVCPVGRATPSWIKIYRRTHTSSPPSAHSVQQSQQRRSYVLKDKSFSGSSIIVRELENMGATN